MFEPRMQIDPAGACARATLDAGDDRLVERACDGDPAAFEAIMRRHNRLLFRTARGIASDDAAAQDVVQDAWLRAFTRLDAYRGEAALGTWLARIAINVAIDAERKRGRIVALDELGEFDDTFSAESTMSLHAAESESPDGAAERGQVRELLQAAIEGLPPIYRSVFMLRAVEEKSVDETAYCLRIGAALVKTRYLRARALLREALGAHIEAGAPRVFAFAGARCDAVVAHVLAALDRQGLILRH